MTQPLDRSCQLPAVGSIDHELGEFWVENPFLLPKSGQNLSAFERDRTFINHEGKRFLDVSFASQANIDSDSRSVVVGDFDRDGAQDILIASVGGGPLRLFRNRYPKTSNRVRIELTGVTSNRAGIGSRIIARVGERQIVRDAFPSNGFMGQSPAELIIGVDHANRIDELTIHWPSGTKNVFQNVSVNACLQITEGIDTYREIGITPASN